MKANEIRQKFLGFFVGNKHRLIKSDSLVPSSDPTLLFTSAGMVQFKNMFLGKTKLEYKRAISCQKCFRTNDIEKVGHTARHLTFFEMLGNFSFGDYFKKEAIGWAWEFLTEVMKLDKEKLWVTVYEDDEEAVRIWSTIVKPERIVRLGKDTNFWEMAATGPCGPCSEIIYDQGEKFSCGKLGCKVGCDCDRYLEVWNLVFTQFDRDEHGTLHPLPQKNIDTGMGLERLAAVVQGVSSNFDTDLFRPIIYETARLANVEFGGEEKNDTAFKIIADHIRGITFLISDGILPSNEGRGYVLRRLIRRAHRFGKRLGIEEPFLHQIAGTVIETMKEYYPELHEAREHIYATIINEEKKFEQTLAQGEDVFAEKIEKLRNVSSQINVSDITISITGEEGFALYDTYGFPPDLTKEMAREQNIKIGPDFDKVFEREMEKQKEKARAAWKGSGAQDISIYTNIHKEIGDTKFVGYEEEKVTSKIAALLVNKQPVQSVAAGDVAEIILFETPFYGETGGQVGDTGKITKPNAEIEIINTLKPLANLIVHTGKVLKGSFTVKDTVEAIIDYERRKDIERNHTATHLLQAMLRANLGTHITQAGSLVEPDRLRFDFTHNQSVPSQELSLIEDMLNAKIRENIPVKTYLSSLAEARKKGAMALFGEKYTEKIRVVEIPATSLELCGGTHSSSTGEIGFFKIISETSIAHGVRRIEALTGKQAAAYVRGYEETLAELARILKSSVKEIPLRIEKLLEQTKNLQKEIDALKQKSKLQNIPELLSKIQIVRGIPVLADTIAGAGAEELRSLGDQLKAKQKSGIFVLCGLKNDKVAILCMVTNDLIAIGYHAGKIVKEVAVIMEGSGGGRPDMAQAGGKNIHKIDEAISKTVEIISKFDKKR